MAPAATPTTKRMITAERRTRLTTEEPGKPSMSLKAFHVFFIATATLMCFGVAGWNLSAWTAGGSVAHVAQAVGWAAAAIGLSVYGVRFLRRYRNLGYLAVPLLLWSNDAWACSVCFGNPESPMAKSMVAGIWVMLGCIGAVLVAFAGLFLYWTYRSYHPHLYREEGATH
jgi:hypothetical protein